ncbi:hypothetical protein [Streptomyces sp. NPDC054797]
MPPRIHPGVSPRRRAQRLQGRRELGVVEDLDQRAELDDCDLTSS